MDEQTWDSHVEACLRGMVHTATLKSSRRAMFFLNDPRFFPDVNPQSFPELMGRARDLISSETSQDVFDGASFLGRVKLCDRMHFAPQSTEEVARMYAEPFVNHMVQHHGLELPEALRPQPAPSASSDEPASLRPSAKAEDVRPPAKTYAAEADHIRPPAKTDDVRPPAPQAQPPAIMTSVAKAHLRPPAKASTAKIRRVSPGQGARACLDQARKEQQADEEEERREALKKRKEEAEAREAALEEKRRRDADAAAAERRRRLIEEMRAGNRMNGREQEPVLRYPPFVRPVPYQLGAGDDRFNPEKKYRIYVCDGCGHIVPFSKKSEDTGYRAHGEFQGSYQDNSWAGTFPARFMQRAYEEGLIDATWYCTQICLAPVTGLKDRTTRTAWHRSRVAAARSWKKRKDDDAALLCVLPCAVFSCCETNPLD